MMNGTAILREEKERWREKKLFRILFCVLFHILKWYRRVVIYLLFAVIFLFVFVNVDRRESKFGEIIRIKNNYHFYSFLFYQEFIGHFFSCCCYCCT